MPTKYFMLPCQPLPAIKQPNTQQWWLKCCTQCPQMLQWWVFTHLQRIQQLDLNRQGTCCGLSASGRHTRQRTQKVPLSVVMFSLSSRKSAFFKRSAMCAGSGKHVCGL